MDACVRYVRAARALIRGASTREAAAVAGEDGVWLVPRSQIESSGYVLHTLRAALWCLTTTDSYLAIQTVVGVQGLVCGAPHTERCAVGRVFAVEQPIAVAFAQVVRIHHAVAVHQGIQRGQRH